MKTRGYLILAILFLTSFSVMGDNLPCQYTETITHSKLVNRTYVNGSVFDGVPISVSNFIYGEKTESVYDEIDSFDIENNLNIPVSVKIIYRINSAPVSEIMNLNASSVFTYKVRRNLYSGVEPGSEKVNLLPNPKIIEKSETELFNTTSKKGGNGICKKPQTPIMIIIFTLSAITLIGYGLYKLMFSIVKRKEEEAREKRLQKEIELLKAKLKAKNGGIKKGKKELAEEQKIKDALEIVKIEIAALHADATKPYLNPSVEKLVWRNPALGGYDCYYNEKDPVPFSNNLVHRHRAERWIYSRNKSYYKLSFNKYEVHHIDGHKHNHRIDNLILLTPDEHKKVTRILKNNEAQGLEAIKKVGIELPPHLRDNQKQL